MMASMNPIGWKTWHVTSMAINIVIAVGGSERSNNYKNNNKLSHLTNYKCTNVGYFDTVIQDHINFTMGASFNLAEVFLPKVTSHSLLYYCRICACMLVHSSLLQNCF